MRISKLADYAVLLATQMAAAPAAGRHSVRELASLTGIPAPTVAKVLKLLAGAGLVQGWRGAQGGYLLGARPEAISLAAILEAVEGPSALTECASGSGLCGLEDSCRVRRHFRHIDRVVRQALAAVSLADLATPRARELVQLTRPTPRPSP